MFQHGRIADMNLVFSQDSWYWYDHREFFDIALEVVAKVMTVLLSWRAMTTSDALLKSLVSALPT
jgi:hypothetical protein